MDIKEIKQQIIAIIQEKLSLPHYKVFLFGSRVNGQASERSDIDIGIEAPEKISTAIMGEIKEALEQIPTLKKFDLVDFKDVDDNFKKVALKTIEVLDDK